MSLDVYLYGERLGSLERAGDCDYEFAYATEALLCYGYGAAALSTSLPTAEEPFSPDATRAFVEGLLPEGMRRFKIARELGIDPDDGYAMIAALGRDCVGGVVFVPRAESVPRDGGGVGGEGAGDAPSPVVPVHEAELEELVAAPPRRLFDPERPQRMRAALPGVRHKLALARLPDGGWAWPEADRPSTHIVKPETGEHPEMVPNEMFCSAVVAETGLRVAAARIERIAGRPCVVSERFDRSGGHPRVRRFHQESFCQALGFAGDADLSVDEAEGPGFAEACGLLRAIGEEARIVDLLAAALCSYVLGNGDAHGSNFALIVVDGGSVLAPFYDIVSSAVYDDPTHVGMTITEDYDEAAYLLELAQICEEAKIGFRHCRRVAANVSRKMKEALPVVAARARLEGWHAPVIDEIVELATERALNLGYEVQY